LLEAGIKLKKNGHPFGYELGHGFGDNHGWLYRCCGHMADERSIPMARPSPSTRPETARAIDFCREFYQKTMFEDVWAGLNRQQ